MENFTRDMCRHPLQSDPFLLLAHLLALSLLILDHYLLFSVALGKNRVFKNMGHGDRHLDLILTRLLTNRSTLASHFTSLHFTGSLHLCNGDSKSEHLSSV